MQRFLIRFFVTHPPAAVALGAVVLLGGAAGATWAYKRGKKASTGSNRGDAVRRGDARERQSVGPDRRSSNPVRTRGRPDARRLRSPGQDSVRCLPGGLHWPEAVCGFVRDAGQWSPQLGLREACRAAVQPGTGAEAPSSAHRGHGGHSGLHPDRSLAPRPVHPDGRRPHRLGLAAALATRSPDCRIPVKPRNGCSSRHSPHRRADEPIARATGRHDLAWPSLAVPRRPRSFAPTRRTNRGRARRNRGGGSAHCILGGNDGDERLGTVERFLR